LIFFTCIVTSGYLKSQYHIFVFIFFLSFSFLFPSCQHLHSPRNYLLLYFSTRRFSRFFLYSMYLSLDPFTQLSIYVYRFTSVFLLPLYLPLNASLTSNTIPHFASCRNTIQPFNCRYGYSYSAAVNNRLHVLFLM